MRSWLATPALAAAALLQSGCSFVLVDGPPSADEIREFHPLEECTESCRVPIVDTIAAVVLPSYGLLKLASINGDDKYLAVPALLSAGVFLTSAIWGYYTVGRCRAYLDPPVRRRQPPLLRRGTAAVEGPANRGDETQVAPPESQKN